MVMMNKHTPVPYEILYETNVVKGNRVVANCGGYSDNANPNTLEDNKANAHFIVTACNAHADLLAACEAAEKFATHFLDKPKKIYWSDLQNLLDELHPAIAKATSKDE